MLLRRVIAHLRKQEWTAIAIDFVIVVVGVFVGLQVNNWNEARLDRQHATATLARLQEEFEAIDASLVTSVQRLERSTRASGIIIEAIRRGDRPDDDDAFMGQLALANTLPDVPPASATYAELVSTGGLTRISDPRLRSALTRYGDAAACYASKFEMSYAAIFDPRSGFLRAVHWSTDPSTWRGSNAIVSYDWARLKESEGELQAWQSYQFDISGCARRQHTEVRLVMSLLEQVRRASSETGGAQ
ncbi:MAG: hypothetical protein JNL81_03860 [Hyphomonadaceae bacterium]|nr:hypothetical protein [Hyphomonadaceae bacterium]